MPNQVESARNLYAYEIVRDIPPLLSDLNEALLDNDEFCREVTAYVLGQNVGKLQDAQIGFQKGENHYFVSFKVGKRSSTRVTRAKHQEDNGYKHETIEIIVGENINKIRYVDGHPLLEPSIDTELAVSKAKEFIKELQTSPIDE